MYEKLDDFLEKNEDRLVSIYQNRYDTLIGYLKELESTGIEMILGYKDDLVSIRNSKYSSKSQNIQVISKLLEVSQNYDLHIEYNACEDCEQDDLSCPLNECVTVK
jgi:hypothetical protein